MKYLVLIVVVLVVLWLLRPRQRIRDDAPPREREVAAEPMVACQHCGVHLPSSDALPGRDGVFCGEAHRAAHEAARRE